MSGIKQFDENRALDGAMKRSGRTDSAQPRTGSDGGDRAQQEFAVQRLRRQTGALSPLLERFAEVHGEKLRMRLNAERLEDAIGGFSTN